MKNYIVTEISDTDIVVLGCGDRTPDVRWDKGLNLRSEKIGGQSIAGDETIKPTGKTDAVNQGKLQGREGLSR